MHGEKTKGPNEDDEGATTRNGYAADRRTQYGKNIHPAETKL